MSSPALNSTSTDPTTTSISHSNRISELSAIDTDVTSLLHSAGLAVQSLTASITTSTSSTQTEEDVDAPSSVPGPVKSQDEVKTTFEQHNNAYLKTLQAVQARLRRQAYALEEAGIVHARGTANATSAAGGLNVGGGGSGTQGKAAEGQVTNGGLGNFDVGWLNSRRDEVGRLKEAELWKEVRERLEGVGRGEEMELDVKEDGD